MRSAGCVCKRVNCLNNFALIPLCKRPRTLTRCGAFVFIYLLQLECQLQHSHHVWPVLIDPRPVVLADHIAVGTPMPHFFCVPIDLGNACGQQLTGLGASIGEVLAKVRFWPKLCENTFLELFGHGGIRPGFEAPYGL